MSKQDDHLKQAIVGTLLSTLPDSLRFELGGWVLNTEDYHAVGHALADGRFNAKHDATLPLDLCSYAPKDNCFYAGFHQVTGYKYQAIIVHEATHAWMDMLTIGPAHKTKVVDSEAAAYVAQMIFVKTHTNTRLTGRDKPTDNIFAEAWQLAKDKKPRMENLEPAKQLKRAIRAHPLYREQANHDTGYDGLGKLHWAV